MAGAMIHRGPDDQGILTLPGAGIATRRLAIIDVQGGHQPIPNEDETIWVALNGEIYNFRALRAGLESRGHRFRTRAKVHCWPRRPRWGLRPTRTTSTCNGSASR